MTCCGSTREVDKRCCHSARDRFWVDEIGQHEMLTFCTRQVCGGCYVRDVHSLLANGSGEKTPHGAVGKKITSELDM